MRDASLNLDALTSEDAAADVRSVFSWSYRQLTPATARMVRLIGIHPGPEISAEAEAAAAAAAAAAKAEAASRGFHRIRPAVAWPNWSRRT